jgi:hypothetical protein
MTAVAHRYFGKGNGRLMAGEMGTNRLRLLTDFDVIHCVAVVADTHQRRSDMFLTCSRYKQAAGS